jgi:hypothetical protein
MTFESWYNASQHAGAEDRDKPQAPQVPAVQNSRILHSARKHAGTAISC